MSRHFPRPYHPSCIVLTSGQQVDLEAWLNELFGYAKPGVIFHAWTEKGYDRLKAVCGGRVLDLTIKPKENV